jgi:ABC-type bacteriocin/lantibiotic exporter with double-glycine peptidase domain
LKAFGRKGTFPCIIHWNFCHFLVLDGFRGNKAYLNDPAGGSYAVSMEQFDEGYTGICLFFEPGEKFQPGGRQTSILAFAKERLKGSKTAILFTVCTTVLLSLLGIFSPVFLACLCRQHSGKRLSAVADASPSAACRLCRVYPDRQPD